MMKHKKTEHENKVSICIDFSQKKCNLDENVCWFRHPEEYTENEKMDIEEATNEEVFHEVQTENLQT